MTPHSARTARWRAAASFLLVAAGLAACARQVPAEEAEAPPQTGWAEIEALERNLLGPEQDSAKAKRGEPGKAVGVEPLLRSDGTPSEAAAGRTTASAQD